MGAFRNWLSRRDVRRRATQGPAQDVVLLGNIWMRGPGRVRFGDGVVLDGSLAPIELHAHEGAEIVIDSDVRIDGGTSIEARQRVHLGARVGIGAFCKILDNHHHRLHGADRRNVPRSSPVEVEEDVVVGARVLLLPGSHLGRGCVVGPGAVVTRRIPDFSHVAGFPATVRREVTRGSS